MSTETTTETNPALMPPKIPVTFSILLSQLKAMDLLASADGTRYVLCGVNVEVTGKNVRLIATDGRKLGVLNVGDAVLRDEEEAAMQPDVVTSFILDSELIGKAARAFRGKNVIVTIERDEKNGVTFSTLDGCRLSGVAIEGTYPDWTKTIPTTPIAAAADLNFNADYLHDFRGTCRLLSSEPYIYFRGHEDLPTGVKCPYSVRFTGVDFFGLLMPVARSTPETAVERSLPAWLPKVA